MKFYLQVVIEFLKLKAKELFSCFPMIGQVILGVIVIAVIVAAAVISLLSILGFIGSVIYPPLFFESCDDPMSFMSIWGGIMFVGMIVFYVIIFSMAGCTGVYFFTKAMVKLIQSNWQQAKRNVRNRNNARI